MQVNTALNHVLWAMKPVPRAWTLTAEQGLEQKRFEAANANVTVYYSPITYQLLGQSFRAAQNLLAQQSPTAAAPTVLKPGTAWPC